MGKRRPGWRQVGVLYLEPSRSVATVIYTLMAVIVGAVAVSALVYRTNDWPQEWRPDTEIPDEALIITAAVAGGFALLLVLAAIVNGRRWHTAAVLERLSEDPALVSMLPDTAPVAPSPRAPVIPRLDVRFVKARTLPRLRARRQRVTPTQNVVGHRPLEIAYLRLFENQPRTRTFIEGAWREFGYVSLLRSAVSITPAEYRAAKRSRRLSGMFISSRDELLAQCSRQDPPHPKGRRAFRNVAATTIRVRDRYGSYPPRALLCHGSFWKAAVDVLLARVDLVALDLSGFRPDNLGTRYELQRVVDRVPVERIVLLADQHSNTKFLAAQIQEAWSQMAAGSPNAVADPKVALVAITDYYAQSMQQQGQSSQMQVRLVARRSQSRRLVATAQDRLDRARATGTATAA
jgi:hypothetical protein